MARSRVLLASGVLFHDEDGCVLLVEPTYKDTWEIPGGVVDAGESPFDACRREIEEELGLSRQPGRLLIVDHCRRPYVQWEGIRFIFSGGRLSGDEVAAIRLPADELRSFRWVPMGDLDGLVAPQLAQRLSHAAVAEETVYLENGELPA